LTNGVNRGTVTATGSTLNFDGAWSNSVSPTLTGSTLNLRGSGAWTAATIQADAASAVNFQGTFSTAGGVLAVTGGGRAGLGGGLLRDMTLTLDAGQALYVDGAGTLSNLTLHGNLDLTRSWGISVNVTNGLTLHGTALVGSADGNIYGGIYFYGTQTIGGTGDIRLGGRVFNFLYIATPETTVTLGPALTVHGARGYLASSASTSRFVNQGTLVADVAGGRIDVGQRGDNAAGSDAGSLLNQGTLAARDGAFLNVHPESWSSTGLLSAQSGGTLALSRSGTSSGSISVAGGTFNLGGAWTNSGPLTATGGGVVTLTNGVNRGTVTATGSTLNFDGAWSNSVSPTLTGSTLNLRG
ncbi:MAG: hypothetical protein LC708_04155, partial [Actinobacteria bacterium]|nr:hypothetical protein [Actinomycetota bacterium]